jgi:hypothetical protein
MGCRSKQLWLRRVVERKVCLDPESRERKGEKREREREKREQ